MSSPERNATEEARRLWQSRYAEQLSGRDVCEILTNMCQFFTILAEWKETRVGLEKGAEDRSGREDAGVERKHRQGH